MVLEEGEPPTDEEGLLMLDPRLAREEDEVGAEGPAVLEPPLLELGAFLLVWEEDPFDPMGIFSEGETPGTKSKLEAGVDDIRDAVARLELPFRLPEVSEMEVGNPVVDCPLLEPPDGICLVLEEGTPV